MTATGKTIRDRRRPTGRRLPLFLARIPAGFPSPADDYLENSLDLNAYLVAAPAATFLVRLAGDAMRGAGLAAGDILVVDRSVPPAHGRIVVAVLDGELAVRRLHLRGGERRLLADNPAYPAVPLGPDLDLQIWGVVTGMVRRL